MTGQRDRHRLKEVVSDLEEILDNENMGPTAEDDIQKARNFAAGAVPVFHHGVGSDE